MGTDGNQSNLIAYPIGQGSQAPLTTPILPNGILKYPDGQPVIDPITNLPYPLPPGLNVSDNVGMGAAIAAADGGFAVDKDVVMIGWFYKGQSEDYQRPLGTSGPFLKTYRDVTNYNYGAVSAAAGYTLDDTIFCAGEV